MADATLVSGLLAAAMMAGTPVAAANGADAPVHLVTEAVANGVRITVVGRSASAYDAKYALEVSSSAAGSNNRSTQRGSVRLRPGVPVTMTTVVLGTSKAGGWTARLKVEPARGAAYEEVRSSS